MNFGNVFLPLVLVSAAVYQPLKYLLPIPAVSVLVALALMAYRVSTVDDAHRTDVDRHQGTTELPRRDAGQP